MKYLMLLALATSSFGATINLNDDNFEVDGRNGLIFSLFVPGTIESAMLNITTDVSSYLQIDNTVLFSDLQGTNGVFCGLNVDGPQCLVNVTLDVSPVLQEGQNYIYLHTGQPHTTLCCDSLDLAVQYTPSPEPSLFALVALALLCGIVNLPYMKGKGKRDHSDTR